MATSTFSNYPSNGIVHFDIEETYGLFLFFKAILRTTDAFFKLLELFKCENRCSALLF